ncbi:acyltransferase family protein [Pseudomonas sp. S2_F03]
MQFHKNINALRALAVLSVVLFHFEIEGFGGGFAGVDVFFVISGFLMTGIIFTGLQKQNFSLLGFYASRARRIVPALLALCVALLVFGFAFLPLTTTGTPSERSKAACSSALISCLPKAGAISMPRCTRTGCCIPGRCQLSGSSTCSTPCCSWRCTNASVPARPPMHW